MSIIIPANSAAGGGFEASNGLRFNSASSDYLGRTNQSPTNADKFTFSTWFKISNIATNVDTTLISERYDNGNRTYFERITNGVLRFNIVKNGSVQSEIATNRRFNDLSAWYHLVYAADSTQGTASNRIKIYINGVQETSFSSASYVPQNEDFRLNTASEAQRIGKLTGTSNYWNGYLAETVFIDGQQLTPTSFGEFDEDSGVWKPIDVSGLTFGDNGFYLDYENSSALGADVSGEGNNFTVDNLTAVDQTTDTCTNNFCLLNPIDKGYGTINFTEGNTQAAGSGSGWKPARATMGVSSGKWYWEVNMSGSNQMGVSNETIDMDNDNAQDLVGVTVFYNASGGIIRTDGSQVGGTTATFVLSDVAGYALDMDNKKLSIYKNGSIIVTNTALSTSITDFALPFFSVNGGGTWKVNFGNPSVALNSAVADGNGYGAFEYTPPSGYLALCTANLSEELS